MKTHEALQRAREVIRRQHKALATEDTYLFWLRHYIQALRAMPPELPSEKKLERFLTDLARSREVSASTQNQALNAVLFFYRDVLGQPLGNIDALRANRPVHERHAPSRSETQLLLQNVRNENGYPTNLIARMLYGCGLRVSEPLNLRIKDLDLEGHRLCIRGAKGGNDRVVRLPSVLVPELIQQMQVARAVWQRDQQDGTPLMLPHQGKYFFTWTVFVHLAPYNRRQKYEYVRRTNRAERPNARSNECSRPQVGTARQIPHRTWGFGLGTLGLRTLDLPMLGALGQNCTISASFLHQLSQLGKENK